MVDSIVEHIMQCHIVYIIIVMNIGPPYFLTLSKELRCLSGSGAGRRAGARSAFAQVAAAAAVFFLPVL